MEALAQLAAIRPPLDIIADDERLKPFETDAFIAHRETPLAAVIADTEEQVREVVRVCARLGVPIVSRGSGTGISGGAIPRRDGILLVLARMRRVLALDPQGRTATVEPGVRNLHVSELAQPHGLFYAPDPSSQVICSIGGNVAENAGGVHCLKYGLTTHNILGLRVVDADGDVLEVGGAALDCAGYDLMALLTGSEGNLGVITQVTVRLVPLPERTETVLAAFASVREAAAVVGEIIGAGVIPAALEMMDRIVIEACERFMALGLPVGAEALLLCEVDGSAEEACEALERVRSLLEAGGATEVRVARDADERERLWKSRKGAFAALATILPDYYTIDGTIPRRCLPDVLDYVYELAREYGMTVGNVFHAGDGNIHPCIFYDSSKPGELERSEELGGRILERCVEVGGTITGEHGVGIEKLKQMCVQFRAPEIAAFHDVKRAFDAAGILNPGKAVPTLNRCAEWGGMHVRGGVVPRPSIPPLLTMASDFIADLCARIAAASAARTPLRLRGGGTKDFYGHEPRGEPVEMAGHAGIVAYEPKELVLTVRAGTPLAEVEAALAAQRQMLPFEPPHYGSGRATIGGTVAAGLSGPRRPYAGSVRDFVLGARIVNGKGEDLSFGGRVIKNVAGYDVSRLMAGALGTLGAITEVSFKVLPLPATQATLSYQLDEAAATRQVNAWAGQPLPISATAWLAGRLLVRLAGAESAVRAARAKMGGEEAVDLPDFWAALRDHRIAFFSGDEPVWRVSVPQVTAPMELGAATLVEWGGGLRWLRGALDPVRVRGEAARAGGHATLFRGGDKSPGVFQPLAPALLKIHKRLKVAFDPAGIFNPGRMYEDF